MQSSTKRNRDSDNTRPKTDFKRKKKCESISSPSAESAIQFLKDVKVFILKAGIENTRMQIFRTQLLKFGGCVHEERNYDTTHFIVDDKMNLDRLCRILKTELPPQNIPIIKCSWLSTCYRQKSLVCSKIYELDANGYVTSKADFEDCNEVLAVKDDIKNTSNINAESKVGPKVGVMWRAFQKSEKQVDPNESDDSDYIASDEELEDEEILSKQTDLPGTSSSDTSPYRKQLPKGNWICAQSSVTPRPNFNKHITDKLEEMVRKYKSTNDTWRAFGYQKGIQALKKYPKEMTSWEEVKALPGVGAKLADKIWEISETGELRKLNEYRSSEDVKILEMFTNIWGAGAHTARTWYQMGYRTLEDLKNKANLTHQQQVGLRLYDDILDRMPRDEAAEIEQVVCEAAEAVQTGIVAQACGSFRRGKATCGDVDVLVTHPDGKSHKGIFQKLLSRLKDQGPYYDSEEQRIALWLMAFNAECRDTLVYEVFEGGHVQKVSEKIEVHDGGPEIWIYKHLREGFLTDDLVKADDNKNQKKYLGVCKLPGENRRHRRLDIIVVPYDEYACAMMYFTGSAHFNRSLRHLAGKMGMSLSEHSLNIGVVRSVNKFDLLQGKEKIFEGTPLATPSEESVFEHLGLPYRTPQERDH